MYHLGSGNETKQYVLGMKQAKWITLFMNQYCVKWKIKIKKNFKKVFQLCIMALQEVLAIRGSGKTIWPDSCMYVSNYDVQSYHF